MSGYIYLSILWSYLYESEFSLAKSLHDVAGDWRRNVYLKFGIIPTERTKNLSLITRGEDPESKSCLVSLLHLISK